MKNVNDPLTPRQLTKLALIGLSILTFSAAGLVGIDYYVMQHGGVDVFIAFAPFCVFPYLIGMSSFVGFFMATFAKGRWKHAWLWGISGFVLTGLFMIGFPVLLSSVLPYQIPMIFAFAPVLSALLIMLLISMRRKVPMISS